jgi:hypothetical protein
VEGDKEGKEEKVEEKQTNLYNTQYLDCIEFTDDILLFWELLNSSCYILIIKTMK